MEIKHYAPGDGSKHGHSMCSMYPKDRLPPGYAPVHDVMAARKALTVSLNPGVNPNGYNRKPQKSQLAIDWTALAGLLRIQASMAEIYAIAGVTQNILDDRAGVLFNLTFSGWAEQFRSEGKVSLRRAMYRKALEEGDAGMMKHLSQHHLDMTDRVKMELSTEVTVSFLEAQQQVGAKNEP